MSLWNPYAFSVTGEPLPPTSPPGLHIMGGSEATAEQRNAAQMVFSSFCRNAQLSSATNLNEGGRLADGSSYRIMATGNGNYIMQLWPVGQDDLRRSGIVFILSDMNGIIPAAHTTDGDANYYMLTPGVVKGTRTANGKWKLRKLKEPRGGGKAVNCDTTGRRYFTGLQGIDGSAMPHGSAPMGSTNAYAYLREDYSSTIAYRGGNNIANSASTQSPIPFTLEARDRIYNAQLIFEQSIVSGAYTISLRVGPPSDPPSDYDGDFVGPVVGSVTLPASFRLMWWKVSIHPSGRVARLIVTDSASLNGARAKCEILMDHDSVTYEMGAFSGDRGDESINYDTPINESSSTIGEGYSRYSSRTNLNAIVNIGGGVMASRPVVGRYGSGSESSTGVKSLIYAFGPDGASVDITTFGSRSSRVTSEMYESSGAFDSYPGAGLDGQDLNTYFDSYSETGFYHATYDSADSEFSDFIGSGHLGTSRTDEQWSISRSSISISDGPYPRSTEHSGGGTRTKYTRELGGANPIYFDRHNGFAAYVEVVGAQSSYTITYPPIGDGVTTSSVNTPYSAALVVMHKKSGELMRKPIELDEYRYLAYAASDPMTGAILVNILKVVLPSKYPVESWMFVADTTGARPLSALVPDITADTRVLQNKYLYSL